MRLIQDLRFVIGLFFILVGCGLLAEGLLAPPADALNLNLYTGAGMSCFALLMIGLALKARAAEKGA